MSMYICVCFCVSVWVWHTHAFTSQVSSGRAGRCTGNLLGGQPPLTFSGGALFSGPHLPGHVLLILHPWKALSLWFSRLSCSWDDIVSSTHTYSYAVLLPDLSERQL